MTPLEIALTVVAIGLAVYVSIQARKLHWQRWEIIKNLEDKTTKRIAARRIAMSVEPGTSAYSAKYGHGVVLSVWHSADGANSTVSVEYASARIIFHRIADADVSFNIEGY